MTDLSAKNLIFIPEKIAPDPLVRKIAERMINRSNVGIKKYGDTMDQTKMGLTAALKNTVEELLDAAVYIEKAVTLLEGEEDGK